jgi:hypothetical protein
MEQSGGGGVEGSNGEGGGGGGGGGSGEEGTKAYSGISSSTYDNRLAALDGVLTKAAHTLGSSYLVPLTSGQCVTLEQWCAERLVNHDEHLVLKSPWWGSARWNQVDS